MRSKKSIFEEAYPNCGSYEAAKLNPKFKRQLEWVQKKHDEELEDEEEEKAAALRKQKAEEEEKAALRKQKAELRKQKAEEEEKAATLRNEKPAKRVHLTPNLQYDTTQTDIANKLEQLEKFMRGLQENVSKTEQQCAQLKLQLQSATQIFNMVKGNVDAMIADIDDRKTHRLMS